jgi:hypothetical protein
MMVHTWDVRIRLGFQFVFVALGPAVRITAHCVFGMNVYG